MPPTGKSCGLLNLLDHCETENGFKNHHSFHQHFMSQLSVEPGSIIFSRKRHRGCQLERQQSITRGSLERTVLSA